MTINGRRGGVLQDGHGLNVLRVDVGDVAVVRHAVQHDERGGATGNGADTADADGAGIVGRVTAGRNHLHTRSSTGEGTGNIGGDFFLNVSGFHLGGRTGEGALGGSTIGYHDGLIQHLAVIHENDGDGSTAVYRNLEFLITHAVDFEDTFCRNTQGECSVDIRHGINCAAALQEHVGTHNRFTGLVFHRTLHSNVLCRGGYRQSQ